MASVDSGDSQISIPVGITIGLLASFVQSLGLTIQRKSHVLNQSLPEDDRKVEHRRPLWLLGFGIFISSNLFGSVFQIASLPIVILAPLGAVSLLWNAFFARLLLGDVFSPWMFIGTFLIAGGAVLIAIFGIVPEPTHSLEDLLVLFSRPVFVAYFSLLGFAVFVCLVITHIVEYSYSRRVSLQDVSPPLSPLLVATTAPSILTTATTASVAGDHPTERTALLDGKRDSPRSKSSSPSTASSVHYFYFHEKLSRTPALLAASYASFSGIISGMCLIFAKSGIELLLLTISGDNQFWRWQAWVLILSLVSCALLQLWYMHKGLVLADPTLVCPLAFCFYNLSSILNSLVYFDQFSLLSTTHILLVSLGIFVLLAGVFVVSFPSTGSYGVDVGTWTEGEPVDEEDSIVEEPEDYEGEPLPLHRRSQTLPATIGEEITDEESALDLHTAQSPTPSLPTRPPLTSGSPLRTRTLHMRPQSDTVLAPTSPLRSRSYRATSPTPSGSRRRRRTTITGTVQSPPHPSTLSPSASGLPAFSIGLSPMSPGFSLVPKERRRRVLGRDSMVPEGADEGANTLGRRDSLFGAPWLRRTVSEGAVDRPVAAAADEERGEGGEGEALLGPASPRARVRWKWLRDAFTGRGLRRS
ncbi:hypothetical protein BKA93DRAFT_722247 [Sparassis latifolia]